MKRLESWNTELSSCLRVYNSQKVRRSACHGTTSGRRRTTGPTIATPNRGRRAGRSRMGNEGLSHAMIVIADAGPILHLYWVDALPWALPPQPIDVVAEVWQQVDRHEPRALTDSRFRRRVVAAPHPSELSSWKLDSGEVAALGYAVSQRDTDRVLVLCDEREARTACARLAIPVVGSIGLIIRAFRTGRVAGEVAQTALRDLPRRGRLHVTEALIELAVEMLSHH